jgi:PhzF family phenazine biosynthesis protein
VGVGSRLAIVDVFGRTPGSGNPLAVVDGGDERTTDECLQVARFFGFSETAFLCTPTNDAADYRVRIFTPDRELPFAGHPTLGAAAAWLDFGGTPRDPATLLQECGVGLVEVHATNGELAFAAPPLLDHGPLDEATRAAILGELGLRDDDVVDVATIDNGPGWIGVLLRSAAAVLDVAQPSTRRFVGVAGCWPGGGPSALEVRAFLPEGDRTIEDPVTGSLQAAFGQWLTARGTLTAPYTATQGRAIRHDGVVEVGQLANGQLTVGGVVHRLAAGRFDR